MAGFELSSLLSPFGQPTPAGPSAPSGPQQAQAPDLMAQWTNWLRQPGNQAMMAQVGAMLLQPMGPGETTAGRVGQAVAGGMAAKERNLASSAKQSEADRQYELEKERNQISRENVKTTAQSTQAYLTGLRNQTAFEGEFRKFVEDQAVKAAATDAEAAKNTISAKPPKLRSPQDFLSDPAFISQATQAWNAMQAAQGKRSGMVTPQPTAAPPALGLKGATTSSQYKVGQKIVDGQGRILEVLPNGMARVVGTTK